MLYLSQAVREKPNDSVDINLSAVMQSTWPVVVRVAEGCINAEGNRYEAFRLACPARANHI